MPRFEISGKSLKTGKILKNKLVEAKTKSLARALAESKFEGMVITTITELPGKDFPKKPPIILNEDTYCDICDELVSHDILEAVDFLDEARPIISDDGYRPPEIRTKLLELHGIAMDFLNNGYRSKAKEFFDLAEEISEELQIAQRGIESALEIIEKINAQFPDEMIDEFDW
jgi:hypothetical protein